MSKRLLVRNGRVVDPAQGRDAPLDVLIEDGKIAAVDPRIDVLDAEVVEAAGKIVVPGFVDMHVHLREPGFEYKETIESGARAAAAGGFTAVAAMANTNPVNDTAAVTELVRRRAGEVGLARVYPIGSTTKSMKGKELTEFGELVEAGAVAVSDDGLPVSSPLVMRRALEYATRFDIPVIEHCETPELHPGGVMHEGYWSSRLGLRGIPSASEDIAVERNILLAELTGGRLHVAHLSTRGALQAVRRAKDRGLPVTCEVTPHHLLLNDEGVREYDTHAKMKPPLRSEQDRVALLEGLADGSIDAIATDHAPHHSDEKCVAFDEAPFGIVGLETAVSLCLDRLVRMDLVSMARLVELLSTNPARILGIPQGTLTVGADADLTLIDLNRNVEITPSRFRSKGRNTPFGGYTLRGKAVVTIVGGKIVWHDDEAPGA